jgi:Telomere resolvase
MSAAEAVRRVENHIDTLAKMRARGELTDDALMQAVAELATHFKVELSPYKTSTQATNYSLVNMTVERRLGKQFWEKSINILKLTREDMAKMISHRAKRNAVRNDDRILIDGELYHEAIVKLSESASFQEICACVCLATGRRPTEVAKTASFAKADKPGWVIFSGQLKKRQGKHNPAIEIPLLVLSQQKLIDLVSKARATCDLKDVTVMEAGKRTNQKINAVFKIIFEKARTVSGRKASVTAEVIRGAYGAIAWRTMTNMATPETSFMGRILGHGENLLVPDFATSAGHYSRMLVYNWPCAQALRPFFLRPDQVVAAQLSESSESKEKEEDGGQRGHSSRQGKKTP